jgi:hypothetical protein
MKTVSTGTYMFPPYYTVNSRLKLEMTGNSVFYKRVDKYLLLGGYDNSDVLTNIKVPEEITLRINSIINTIK